MKSSKLAPNARKQIARKPGVAMFHDDDVSLIFFLESTKISKSFVNYQRCGQLFFILLFLLFRLSSDNNGDLLLTHHLLDGVGASVAVVVVARHFISFHFLHHLFLAGLLIERNCILLLLD